MPKDMRELLHRNQLLMPWAPGRSVSTARAAEMLGVCQTTIRDMIERKELRGCKIRPKLPNSPYRVFRDSIVEHIRSVCDEYEIEGLE